MATRSKSCNSAFGYPTKFPVAMIPSKADVFLHYNHTMKKEQVKDITTSSKDVYRIVAQDIIDIWNLFSFPTVSFEGVCLRVGQQIEKCTKLNKVQLNRRNEKFAAQVNVYTELFDICSCECYNNGINLSKCKCRKKIPVMEWDAFVGQENRKNQLRNVDTVVLLVKKRVEERLEQDLGRRKKALFQASTSYAVSSEEIEPLEFEEDMETETTNDEDFMPEYELRENIRNLHRYDKLAITADRYHVSSRAEAAIVYAVLFDLGILDETNMMDRKKVA